MYFTTHLTIFEKSIVHFVTLLLLGLRVLFHEQQDLSLINNGSGTENETQVQTGDFCRAKRLPRAARQTKHFRDALNYTTFTHSANLISPHQPHKANYANSQHQTPIRAHNTGRQER